MIKPVVTVGIPVYNCENFIALAVKSVLNQTFTNFELIITDDGSTDDTLKVLRQFNDSRISIIADGKNNGISYRLNQQINLAKGRYFCRMDGDDIMFPDRLERQVAYLESHQDVDVVGSPAVIIDDENEIIGTRGYLQNAQDGICESFIHPTVCGKIEFFKKYEYRDEVKGIEDADLWIRSRRSSRFMKLNSPVLFYRDPLRLKLNVYLFRQQQYRKGLNSWLKQDLIGKFDYMKLMLSTYLKSLLAISLSALGCERLMVKRRNKECSEGFFVLYDRLMSRLQTPFLILLIYLKGLY